MSIIGTACSKKNHKGANGFWVCLIAIHLEFDQNKYWKCFSFSCLLLLYSLFSYFLLSKHFLGISCFRLNLHDILYQLPGETCPVDLPGDYFWFLYLSGDFFWSFNLPCGFPDINKKLWFDLLLKITLTWCWLADSRIFHDFEFWQN